jgi:hypothetical protein
MNFTGSADYDLKRVADNLGLNEPERAALRMMNLASQTAQVAVTKGLLTYFTGKTPRLSIGTEYVDRKDLLKGILRHQAEHGTIPNTAEMLQYAYMSDPASRLKVHQAPQFSNARAGERIGMVID